MNYLDKICDYKRQELEAVKRMRPLDEMKQRAADAEAPRLFYEALSSVPEDEVAIIAEIKKASPSRGVMVHDFDVVALAETYQEHDARALSILTDEHFFQGRLEYLEAAKQHVSLPVLRKDFTLDEYHIYEARTFGADAVLLIARVLESTQLAEYHHMVADMGMTSLIEIHDESDLKKVGASDAMSYSARLLMGVNNRNLETFECDLATTEGLKAEIPSGVSVVSESGIRERGDIERLQKVGVNIFLIGEALLVAEDPGSKLRELAGP